MTINLNVTVETRVRDVTLGTCARNVTLATRVRNVTFATRVRNTLDLLSTCVHKHAYKNRTEF